MSTVKVNDESREMGTSYARFVILSNARTGSNLIQQALNSHPALVCFRELFNLDPDYIDFDRDGWDGHGTQDLALRNRDIASFLAQRIFGEHPPAVKAVGFKFHYDHFWFDEALVPTLISDKELRIVHLRRKNRLRTYVSLKIAAQTGEWLKYDQRRQRAAIIRTKVSAVQAIRAGRHPLESVARIRRFLRPAAAPLVNSKTPLVLSAEECRAFFYKVGHEESHFANLFEGHPIIDIWYEGLARDRTSILAQVQQFLDVPSKQLSTTLEKQNPDPLRELISNYDELRSAFTGSEEEAYFD